jgi:hypothetical protein
MTEFTTKIINKILNNVISKVEPFSLKITQKASFPEIQPEEDLDVKFL